MATPAVECYTAVNLEKEWRSSYLKAMGLHYADWITMESTAAPLATTITLTLTNLLPDKKENGDTQYPTSATTNNDDSSNNNKNNRNTANTAWTDTAAAIQAAIRDMVVWIHSKKWHFGSVYMTAEEASLIQSTVTSFVAQTATEIDGLRHALTVHQNQNNNNSHNNNTWSHHCHSIVQILLTDLQQTVAQPFRVWQKQRQRAAVQLWQSPYRCALVDRRAVRSKAKKRKQHTNNADQELDDALGLRDDDDDDDDNDLAVATDQRFMPRQPNHRLQHDFLESYADNDDNDCTMVDPRPTSTLFGQKRPAATLGDPAVTDATAKRTKTSWSPLSNVGNKLTPSKQQQQASKLPHDNAANYNDDDEQQQQQQMLQQEALVLTAAVENDLDAVQQMERMMVDITALLSQFTDLVSDQQEDVWEIHDAVAQTKDNMRKGQESLVDATERTRSSKHWTATVVSLASVLLLFFHWIRP
jgi:hypothetical protein